MKNVKVVVALLLVMNGGLVLANQNKTNYMNHCLSVFDANDESGQGKSNDGTGQGKSNDGTGQGKSNDGTGQGKSNDGTGQDAFYIELMACIRTLR